MTRLDVFLVKNQMAKSRQQAKALILSSCVSINGKIANKPAMPVLDEMAIKIIANNHRYVGRGGLKLERAIASFKLNFMDKVCIDIGASTGGFTDCMLKSGARHVYAVDVGANQLAESLKSSSKVTNLEGVNIRYIDYKLLPQKIDFITIDVSFISLSLILPTIAPMLDKEGELIVLIKPQFEVGKSKVGKKGVVKNPKYHLEAILKIIKLCHSLKISVNDLDFSGIKGQKGNIEYLMHIGGVNETKSFVDAQYCKKIVADAHLNLTRPKRSRNEIR